MTSRKSLRRISEKLRQILDTGSEERIMLFTGDPELMELIAQINRLLDDRQNLKINFYRSENASRKMLANISHDIRTPMTVLLGYLEIMRTTGNVSLEMLKKAEQKAQSIMDLISRFFLLARLESKDLVPELSALDACEICRECVLDFYEVLIEHDFQVHIRIPEIPVLVLGNQDALRRILSNLISNAVRYGAGGHYLECALTEEERTVSICVTDHGPGIDRISAEHIFDRLYTMEDARSRNFQGSGLGLAIAKNLARQLGGDLTLESVPSVQTSFTLRLKRISRERNL